MRHAAWISALLILLLPLRTAAQSATSDISNWQASGPKSLVLTYRVAPAARTTFRSRVRAVLLPRLATLQSRHEVATYRVLANRYLDSASWDVLVQIDFASSEALARWRNIEDATPGGLDDETLRLVAAAESAPGSVMRSRQASSSTGDVRPVYLIVPYDYLVSTDEYLRYLNGYLIPQVDEWIGQDVLSGYSIFLPRYAAGRAWSSLLILAYRGDVGLAKRDAMTRTVRAHLAETSPSWKSYANSKASIRTEKQPIVADEILP